MECSLTINSKSTKDTIITTSKTIKNNKFIVEQYLLPSENNLDLNNAILDMELDDSLFDIDDSDKFQVCHQTAFTIDSSNYIIKKRLNIRLIPNKISHQITYKINNNDNDNNGNDNNSNNNNNNKSIDNYNNNSNNTRNKFENKNRNHNKNNNIFNNIKTENQKKLCSRHKSKNKMNSLSIQKQKSINEIFNLIISRTILN